MNYNNFDWIAYVSKYIDLKNANINTKELAWKHWIEYGKSENREANIIIDTNSKLFDIGTDTSILDLSLFSNIEKYETLNYNNYIDKNMFLNTKNASYKLEPIETINYTQKCILVIDFPNIGGGTTFFLNSIISKYKKNTMFLIARNYDGMVHFIINDEYILKKIYNESESIEFLETYNSKIDKIFVNHTLKHSINFMKSLFSLNKKITIITHDYSLLFDTFLYKYDDITTYKKNEININKYDCIITQNKQNLYYYKNYINPDKKIIISPLPDYKSSNVIINSSSTNIIVIGIIGIIHEHKGSRILNILTDHYKDSENIKFVIFGDTNDNNIREKIMINKYESIDELNSLFIKHRPNLLIELSIWPETYSYTLTLCMNFNLPILFLRKNQQSVVENRLSTYDKAYGFETLSEFNETVPKIKQDYFHLIDTNIYFNDYWDKYFTIKQNLVMNKSIKQKSIKYHNTNNDNFINKNIVLITSKIYVSNYAFSYTNTRSTYSKEQRFIQTIETIKSIKKYIINPYIILFDNSIFNSFEYDMLLNMTDKFINIINDEKLNYYTNVYNLKAYAEMSQQVKFYEEYLQNINIQKIRHFFKISGRYCLNETFNYNIYNNDKNIFKKNMEIKDRNYYYTSFYKLSKNILERYFNNLISLLNVKDNDKSSDDFEVIVPNTIISEITLIDNLGIKQFISISSTTNDI